MLFKIKSDSNCSVIFH